MTIYTFHSESTAHNFTFFSQGFREFGLLTVGDKLNTAKQKLSESLQMCR